MLLDAIAKPGRELHRLVQVAQADKRTDGEGAVAYPGEAVVPVAFSTDLLGEGRRRCCHKCSAWRICHELERDRRTIDHFAPATDVGRLPDPAAPKAHGLLHELEYFLGVYWTRRNVCT